MKLVNKKKVNREGKEFLISISKSFFDNINGTDYYIYYVKLYDARVNIGIKGIFIKNDLLLNCRTYWLNYYNYNGDIDAVIEWVLKRYEFNMREKKYISEKEKQFIER